MPARGQRPRPPHGGELPRALEWSELLARLDRSHEALAKALAALDEDVLDEKVKGRRESYYVLLQGIIHHDLHHAGQIAILKRGLSGHRA